MNSYNKHILCFSLYLVLFFNADQAKCDPQSFPPRRGFSTSLQASVHPVSNSALGAATFDSDLFEPISAAASKGSAQVQSPTAHSPASSPISSNRFGQASSPHVASVPSASRPLSAKTNGRILRQSMFTRSPSLSPKASAAVPSGSPQASSMSLTERMKKKFSGLDSLTSSLRLGEVSSASSPISKMPTGAPEEHYRGLNSPAPSPKSSNRIEQAFSSLGSKTMSLYERLKKQFTGAESSSDSLKSSNNLDSVPSGSVAAPTMSSTKAMKNRFTAARSPASSPESSIHLHRISRLLHASGLSTSKPITIPTTVADLSEASPRGAPAPSVLPLMSLTRNLRKRRSGAYSPASSPKSPVYPHKVSRILRYSAPSKRITHPPASSPKPSVNPHKVSPALHKSAPSTSHSTVAHPPVSSPKSSVHLHKVPRAHPHKVSRAHPRSVPSTSHSTVTHPAAAAPKSSVHPHKVPKVHPHKVHPHKATKVHPHKVSRILITSVPSAASPSSDAYPPASSFVSFPPLSPPDSSLVTDPAIKGICGKTAYPDLCLSAVSLYIKTSNVQSNEIRNDPMSVLEMVITAAVQHTNLAVKFANRKATESEDPTTASTFQELKENYSDALYNFNGAVNAIHNKDASSVKMMLSAALDDFSQYQDNHGRRSPLADRDTKLAQMTSIGLNIASMVNTKQ